VVTMADLVGMSDAQLSAVASPFARERGSPRATPRVDPPRCRRCHPVWQVGHGVD
jgi:hypothetical protein